eukprot:GHUV01036479.1.p1 GENE.GHUV01036479.1~~GHUV01036479.1.p1  ORF type:complete len:108 (-),score=3.92 GHUV01036479.1:143-466(-)
MPHSQTQQKSTQISKHSLRLMVSLQPGERSPCQWLDCHTHPSRDLRHGVKLPYGLREVQTTGDYAGPHYIDGAPTFNVTGDHRSMLPDFKESSTSRQSCPTQLSQHA